MTSRDRGGVTIQAAAVFLMLMAAALVIVQVAVLVQMRHRVAAAADLAALAGAQASVQGEDGCLSARVIARRNGARLVSCRMDYDVATVTATSTSLPWWGDRWITKQRARAAPDYYVD